MAVPAEALPQTPGQLEYAEAYLGRRPMVALVEGQYREFLHPGNFPQLFEAYLNLGASPPDGYMLPYDKYLTGDGSGRIVAEALDRLVRDEAHGQTIISALSPLPDEERAFYYAQMIEAAAGLLPDGYGAEILRDPPSLKEAA